MTSLLHDDHGLDDDWRTRGNGERVRSGDRFEVVFEPWTLGGLLRDYRRVPLMAIFVGVIAFMGSMIVPPSYVSGTRLLIRGRDTTLLDSTGGSLSGQPGVLDSQLAASLAETQAALLVTRSVAVEIVDRLELDAPAPSGGIVGAAKRFAADAYLRTRAIVTHGFYRKPERRERMIGQVQGGIGAKQVEDGFVIEVAAIWEEPEIAAEIANEAADILVEQSKERFASESATYRDFLQQQVTRARQAEDDARAAVADFQRENGITSIDEELRLSTVSIQDLDDRIDQTRADLRAAEARSDSLGAQLAELSPTIETDQSITTGRSSTEITTTEANPTYTSTDTQYQEARASAAALDARLSALTAARDRALDAGTAQLTSEESELRQLLFDQQIAADQVARLTADYHDAVVNADRPQVELMRLDEAVPAIYPVGPKRYLYLGIGIFVGGLLGFVWSFLKVKRREQRLLWEASTTGSRRDRDRDLAID